MPKDHKKDKELKKQKAAQEEAEQEDKRKPGLDYAKGVAAPNVIPGFNVQKELDSLERAVGSNSMALGKNETRMSTGNCSLDIVMGGGLTSGMYTNFGKEQSGKTTGQITVLASALIEQIPIIDFWDYEGSTGGSLEYVANILRTMGVRASAEDIFGLKDKEGNWVIQPRIRYHAESVAELFFDYVSQLERQLPDKIFEGEQWWYVYDDSPANRKKLGSYVDQKDEKRSRKSGRLYFPAEDGTLQALILVDSYPNMNPERLDVDDPRAGLAALARMFSAELPRIKGKLRRKRIAILGVNLLADVPMAMYGPSEKEKCGNALRAAADARIRFTSRALSGVPEAKAGKINGKNSPYEVEDSVEYEGGQDVYRYVRIKGEKNKLGTPYLEAWMRVWITDGNGDARGYDPVFDIYTYLQDTGQLEGKRNKILLKFKGNEATRSMPWEIFKRLILGEKALVRKLCEKAGMRPVFLRRACLKQLQNGEGFEMYIEHKKAVLARRKERGENVDDDEESPND